ncbi:Beta-lactamase precursor [Sphingobium herbicidovorans NBRC 16415]|uniref:Beta-lactamase n=1 Tax=Sphingobium herbicidovorans (strain ATCC 700291 / DSM 11019 / CCUG 56400 / KCTC 2939 / LMG 18315 / NBRC 16415 / MH) TaxID=1219045 RepID=A0A086PCP3_SPHHM|nr:SGM family class A beta-lactamase [Sphingobium herbicidovorans]KFG91161.1 Beta-lactamase precursor [Sphingobium herbicidovorans NBRC 16415]
MRLRFVLLAAALTLGVGNADPQQDGARQSLLPPPPRYMVSESVMKEIRNPRTIEEETGGRLGVALVDSKGALILGFNRDERFAMCSTFKAPLAAAVLMGADAGRFGLEGQVAFTDKDLLDHAPVVKANRKRGRLSMEELAKAAVEVSDNSAANLLLPMIGGPEGLTAFVRAHGDTVTRLDRLEPALNENTPGDPRDTTSPAAMAGLIGRLLFRDMQAESAARLTGWLNASKTGDKRIKAGLPPGWTSGGKTGSCGTAFNDVALVEAPSGERYILAVYLDRPTGDAKAADAAIAEAARAALEFVGKAQPTGL